MCSGEEMTSPPLSDSDKMFPSKLCNPFVSLALHHCLSKPLTLSSFSSLLVPCLIAFPLNHCTTAFPAFHTWFNLLRNCPLQPRNRVIMKWLKQLFRNLISNIGAQNITHEETEKSEKGEWMGINRT